MRTGVSFFAILLTAAPGLATSYARPERHDVFSPNGAFVLDVNPETKTHTVYDVRDRATPLWSFSEPVWQAPFYLSNDGAVVVSLEWEHVKVEHLPGTPGIYFRNRQGVFRQYLITDLCPDPPKTQDVGIGPIGDFWRTWYTKTDQDDETITLRTTRGVEFRFRTSDGELIERRDVGTGGRLAMWVLVLVGAIVLGVAAGLMLARARGRARPSDPDE